MTDVQVSNARWIGFLVLALVTIWVAACWVYSTDREFFSERLLTPMILSTVSLVFGA